MAEFDRIAKIAERLTRVDWDIETNIGDDAAVLRSIDEDQVLSVDASVEGVHFRRDFAPLDVIGERAVLTAVSDLIAMGATPRASLVALNLPDDLDEPQFDALIAGLERGAEQTGAYVIGGNLSRAQTITITTTAIGSLTHKPVLRSGASPGDHVFVTGTLGGAALGLALIERATNTDDMRASKFIRRWTTPAIPLDLGAQLHAIATAAIDISDGTLQDLGHLCRASRCGATIELGALPVDSGFAEVAQALELDADELVLNGGEDYQLLFTSSQGELPMPGVTRIGRIDAEAGLRLVDRNGQRRDVAPRGYEHRWTNDK